MQKCCGCLAFGLSQLLCLLSQAAHPECMRTAPTGWVSLPRARNTVARQGVAATSLLVFFDANCLATALHVLHLLHALTRPGNQANNKLLWLCAAGT